MKKIYLDHAAATPLDPQVLLTMLPYLKKEYGNPSSFHTPGKSAQDAIENSRQIIARLIGARPDEIIFTSGGTESINLAVLGYTRASRQRGNHIITTKIEHHAVLETIKHLEKKEGFKVTYLPVDKFGLVDLRVVQKNIRPNTILISIIVANNEIGTIEPIAAIGNLIQKMRGQKETPIFHTDACQAAGALDLNIQKLHVDMLTINGSKIYGPKGIGALYLKRGLKLQPIQFGGAQERGLRPGTENVAGIVGLAKALEIAQAKKEQENKRLIILRDKLMQDTLKNIPKTRLNGHPTERLPNNINISFMDIEGEALLLHLDSLGIYASTGSACTSTSLDPSHVIMALGVPYEVAHGSLRFTLGRETTQTDIDYVLKVLPPIVEKLRQISPVRVKEKYFR